jgi:cytochrome c-type biogenesis protein
VDVGLLTLGLALVAGLLTTLNPCVLPLLPVVAGSAAARHRAGLFALGGGMALSFTGLGVVLAGGGMLLGLRDDQWRVVAAVVMLVFGAILASDHLQSTFSRLTAGLGARGDGWASRLRSDHPAAQAVVGAVLGVAWTPCIGPTLGAAMSLAAAGESLGAATLVMFVFSVAAVTPLIGAGLASRRLVASHRERMARIGRIGRRVMGVGLLAVGLLVLTGADKRVESWLLDLSPEWLLRLTSSV